MSGCQHRGVGWDTAGTLYAKNPSSLCEWASCWAPSALATSAAWSCANLSAGETEEPNAEVETFDANVCGCKLSCTLPESSWGSCWRLV